MNGLNQDIPGLQSPPTVKVSTRAQPQRKPAHERIAPWTKLRWKVRYWWHKWGACPNFKSPGWVATLSAFVLVTGLVSITFAYSYTVQPGDTLFSIARRNNTTVSALAAANQIANPHLIHVGQILEISGETQGAPMAAAAPAPAAAAQFAGPSAQPNTAVGATYMVQPGDTLYRIARRYGTTVTALAQANHLSNVNTIHVGQILIIPASTGSSDTAPGSAAGQGPSTAYHPDTPPPSAALDPSQIPSSLPDVPHTPATTDPDPEVAANRACARFNFMQGRDSHRGSRAGVYVLHDITGGQIASWYAHEGDLDSGWINGLPLSHDAVHVRVVFYPKFGGGSPIQMEIVNPAPGTGYGWLSQGACHSIELQYPAGY